MRQVVDRVEHGHRLLVGGQVGQALRLADLGRPLADVWSAGDEHERADSPLDGGERRGAVVVVERREVGPEGQSGRGDLPALAAAA